MPDFVPHPASYRDPSGFVFRSGNTWYRQVNTSYGDNYLQLMQSGLYRELIEKGLLLPFSEVEENITGRPNWFKTLLPEQLPFISYPEEWIPAQLKQAAVCTLAIARIAIGHDMILKDATPRNIQFRAGKPVLIDSLSFERYDPSMPWVAYRQFCECFLYPLYLHHFHGDGTHRTIIAWPEGIPAGVVSKHLPWRSRFSLGVWLHVRLPAGIHKTSKTTRPGTNFDKTKLLRLLGNLESIVSSLRMDPPTPAGWTEYYSRTILSQGYLQEKEKLFRQCLETMEFSSALDLGANDGYFSLILAEKKAPVIAVDSDWQCMNKLYELLRISDLANILPVCVDIVYPTPASGFRNAERASFTTRFHADLVTALALIHHLALGRNLPLSYIADYFSDLTGTFLLIEFIPLSDPKASELLAGRTMQDYDLESFECCFGRHFTIELKAPIPGTERTLYAMKKHPK